LAHVADCSWMTGKPEVIGSYFGLVPTNALVLTGLANFLIVRDPEVIDRDLFHDHPETLALVFRPRPIPEVLQPRLAGHEFKFRMARDSGAIWRGAANRLRILGVFAMSGVNGIY